MSRLTGKEQPQVAIYFKIMMCVSYTLHFMLHLFLIVIQNLLLHTDGNVDLNEVLVDMIIGDSQPFSIVEGRGFKKLIKALAPSYILPTRQVCMHAHEVLFWTIMSLGHCFLFLQTLKAMVEKRYKEAKEKAKATVAKASAICLTSDMWKSINMDAYLAVTCHFIDETSSLQSVVIGVQHFP